MNRDLIEANRATCDCGAQIVWVTPFNLYRDKGLTIPIDLDVAEGLDEQPNNRGEHLLVSSVTRKHVCARPEDPLKPTCARCGGSGCDLCSYTGVRRTRAYKSLMNLLHEQAMEQREASLQSRGHAS